MSKRPRSPDPRDSSDQVPREKVIVVDPSSKIFALQIEINQLKQEKNDLMSRSFAELQQHEERNRALDKKVQQLMKDIEDLNKEADDLMNTDNEGVKVAEDKRDDLYKQLMVSNAEVCKLQMRVGILEQELQSHKSIDLAKIQALDRGKDTRDAAADKQQFFCDASTQTDQEGITNMLTASVIHVPLRVVNPVVSSTSISKREEPTLPIKIAPAIHVPHQAVNSADDATIAWKGEEVMLSLGKPTILPYPADASAHSKANMWFEQAFTYLNIDLGRDYLALLSSWMDKERIGAYESPRAGLKKENRPAALTAWQKKQFNKSSDDTQISRLNI